jgi:ferric-dicitrate binding protein FerR (iron transport regulator)
MSDDLLVKYLLRETTPGEDRQVEAWIAETPGNQRYFDHFKLIWDSSRELAAQSTVSEEDAWQRFQNRVKTGNTSETGRVRSMGQRISAWRVAATLVATAGILAMIYFLSVKDKDAKAIILATTNTSVADTLPDGSVITLNKHSSISYEKAYNKKERAVELDGEAFFKVAHNKNKPFVVHVNGLTVTVTGTSFNIKTINGKTEVIVETGSVQVSNGRQTIALTPKQKVVTGGSADSLTKEGVTDQLYSYYRDKVFVCDNTPLWKLVEVLNEAYDAHIVIESKEKRNLPLTATYNNESLDKVLELVAQTLELTVTPNNSRIILK